MTDLAEYLQFDWKAEALVEEDEYKKIYNVELVPLTGKSMEDHVGPRYSPEENPTVPTVTPLPVFARLDFEQVPITMQPTLCLQEWLQCRGCVKRKTDTRAIVERNVKIMIAVGRHVLPPSIKFTPGKCTGFEALDYRQAGNKCDTWNKDYFGLMKRFIDVTDGLLNRSLGESLPGISARASLLLEGGNLNPMSIECLNVKSKINDNACILLRVECLSSERSIIHTVHAVLEDEPDGDFLLSPLSTCSCEDGSLLLSFVCVSADDWTCARGLVTTRF